jgi:hypothetical protein
LPWLSPILSWDWLPTPFTVYSEFVKKLSNKLSSFYLICRVSLRLLGVRLHILYPIFIGSRERHLWFFVEFAVATTPLALSRFGKAVNLAVYCVSDARPTFAYDILSTEPQRVKVYFSLLRMSPPLKRRFSELSLLCFPLRRVYPQA